MVSQIGQSSEVERVSMLICEIDRRREHYLNGKQRGLNFYK
jgi:hypothetical protein